MPTLKVVVDTSTILLLISSAEEERYDQRTRNRILLAQDNMRELRKNGAVFLVPSPAIVELSRDGPGEEIARRTMAALGGLRVESLDLRAATYAGEMCRSLMAKKPSGDEKRAIRFDALIAAIAHRVGAKYLATANAKDFRSHLSHIKSTVEVYPIDEQPPGGQLKMLAPRPARRE